MNRHDDFRPTAGRENLRLRAGLLRRTREFFDRHGFLEVETPILSADTVVDRHLDPFQLEVSDPSGGLQRPRWLQTSPEFAMKRLLAAGFEAIYQITRVFRQGEQGPLHNPEFTMVEWYRAHDGLDEGMQLTGDLCDALLQRGQAERLTYAEAFRQYVGLDPHTAETGELLSAVHGHGIVAPESLSPEDRDGWLDLLLVERVQPNLGRTRPVILYDYPASQAALARIRPDDPPVAERFELYVSGVELANGFHELLDPEELLQRNAAANARRRADGKPPLPEQSRLIAAMRSGLPAAVGVALGFDRLVMLSAGAKSLAEVMAFPFDRA
ncbi:MAG TPA: EF-P lysine aminoacylase EpmA [Thermoguttaceae bacterium]|nr:EF-P lysine aminoacylase EpmA [Thermoguttaceae bacterium]